MSANSTAVAVPADTAQQSPAPAIKPDAATLSAGAGPEAIFVVGVHRSGTTLMRKLLETSPLIGIARESHYVGHIIEHEGARFYFRKLGDLKDDETIRKIVELVYSGEFQKHARFQRLSPYWRWAIESVPREQLEQRLLASDRTERGFMTALMRLHSDLMGRPIMGEKTPAHLRYVDTLLEWFPNGRVIHTIRDPRAIYVSDVYRRSTKLRKPYSWLAHIPGVLRVWLMFQTIALWRSAVRMHEIYQRKYPGRYMALKFEDIVQRPQETLPPLFEFLDVPLPDFTTVRVNAQHGMRDSSEGLDPTAADRWRKRISPVTSRIMAFALRKQMSKLGYTR